MSGEQAQIRRFRASDDAYWTISDAYLPETIGFVPTLRCLPKAWKKPPPSDLPLDQLADVQIESVEFESRFNAQVDVFMERNWLVQLLTPSFLLWLTEGAHDDFGFEMHEGRLRCFRAGTVSDEDLSAFEEEAERVAERIRSEAEESEGLGVRELGANVSPKVERVVKKVTFDRPPADVSEASLPFRRFAARDPSVYVTALGGIITGYVVLLGLLFEAGLDAVDLIISLVRLIGPESGPIAMGIFTVGSWLVAIPGAIALASRRYGRVAFVREYARDRGLAMESPQSFHRRLMRVTLPAPAEFVMHGELGPSGLPGRIVLCRSRSRLLSSYFDAVVLDLPVPGMDRAQNDMVNGGMFVASQSSPSNHSAMLIDVFVDSTLKKHREAQLKATSSTSPSGS